MTYTLTTRRRRYFDLSSRIAQIDDARLRALFEGTEASTGWGRNLTLDVGGQKVFVKRIPVTDREHENQFSTRNLYNLPTYYNYGVGSAGFGVWRELVAHVKTTNWVLAGQTESFPLMYHYRIVRFWGERSQVDMERHKGYVEYWGGDENIGRYMLDRAAANHELVLFLEHVPYMLQVWLQQNPGRMSHVLEELRRAIDFLRKHGVIHFDAHFWNIMTDGRRVFLTDFGLALDKCSDLSPAEHAFFKSHTYYDYGEVLSCMGYVVHQAYEALPEAEKHGLLDRFGAPRDANWYEIRTLLLNNLEAIDSAGTLSLDRRYVACVLQYRPVMGLMYDFYSSMQQNQTKDTPLNTTRLKRLLKQTGYI